jgi:hypothetical protein
MTIKVRFLLYVLTLAATLLTVGCSRVDGRLRANAREMDAWFEAGSAVSPRASASKALNAIKPPKLSCGDCAPMRSSSVYRSKPGLFASFLVSPARKRHPRRALPLAAKGPVLGSNGYGC